MIHRAPQHPLREWISNYLSRKPQTIAYIGLALAIAFSVFLYVQTQNSQDEKRCEGGVETRNVDRDQTQRIYLLALSFAPKSKEAMDKLTPEQRKRTKSYIAEVENFRRESFATIKPSDLCAPYVDDDNVTPEQWEKEHPPQPVDES